MAKYLDPKAVLTFKKVFGEHKELVISFLNHLLQPVYSLNIVNDTFEPDMEEYYHYYHMVHDLHTDKVLEGLHLVFVELPKFKAKNLVEKKMQVLWLRFLTEIDTDTRQAPQELLDDPHVNKALEILEESAYSKAEMYAYDKF